METRIENRRIVVNAASNAAHMGVRVAVMFFVMPILVHGLGDVRFGIWMFVNSIVGYLALGKLGVNKAVIRYVAKYDGLDDYERINRVFNTSSAFFACVGACILAVTASTAYFWRRPSGVSTELAGEARCLLLLLGCTFAVGLTLAAARGVLAGLGRFPATNSINVASLLLRNALLVGAVWSGGGLVTVGAIILGVCVLQSGCNVVAARCYFPRLAFSPRYIDWETVRTLGGYGLNVFVGAIATIVIGQSAFLVIGAFLSPESVTYFSLGSLLNGHAITVLAAVMFVLTPAVSKWEATGDHAAIRRLFIVATRYGLFIAGPIEVGLLILGRPFLALWMGSRYADVGYMTLVVLSVPLLLAASNLAAGRILEGIGKVRPLALLGVAQAVVTVILSVALVRPFGIEGVALGISLALAVRAFAVTLLLCGYLQVSSLSLLRQSFFDPLLASAVVGAVWILAKQWLFPNDWGTFFGIGLLGMVLYAIIVIALEPRLRRMAASMVGGFAKRAF